MGRTPDYLYIIVVIFLAILFLIEIFYPFIKKKSNSDWKRKSGLWFQEFTKMFQERFPNQPFHIDESNPYIIMVPPKHPAVGGLRISDGGDNIIVEIGPFTHEHFWEDVREDMVSYVLHFVEEVFEDKIEFYGGPRGGGHQERGQKTRGYFDKLYFGKTTYVWSGPIEEQ